MGEGIFLFYIFSSWLLKRSQFCLQSMSLKSNHHEQKYSLFNERIKKTIIRYRQLFFGLYADITRLHTNVVEENLYIKGNSFFPKPCAHPTRSGVTKNNAMDNVGVRQIKVIESVFLILI